MVIKNLPYDDGDIVELRDQDVRQLKVAVEMLTIELSRITAKLVYLSSRVESLEHRVYSYKTDESDY